MANTQSEFPLTLAEVLFAELKSTRPNLDESQPNIVRVKAKLKEIEDLRTEEGVAQICEREGIKINPSAETAAERIWDCKYELSKRLVPDLYTIIRELPQLRSALCLSGGGVRSAVFNLGILQGLARCGLLDKFDYLSTVSGGGFIASWLSAWIHRENGNVGTVVQQLAKAPDNPLEPEPTPLYNLRVYANYLTPKKGLLSPDTWTLIAVYLRNLLLNWMVFVPAIMAFLMLPRIWLTFVSRPGIGSDWLLRIGFVAAVIALVYIGTSLPSAKVWNFHERWFVWLCLLPLVISAMALTTFWVGPGKNITKAGQFIQFAVLLGAISWGICIVVRVLARMFQKKESNDKRQSDSVGCLGTLVRGILVTPLILGAFALSGLVVWYVPAALDLQKFLAAGLYLITYASLAVPLLLVLLTLGGTFIAGFTSRLTDVDDQEWWARAGAWILIVVLGWTVFHLLVLFGPVFMRGTQNLLTTLLVKRDWSQVSFSDARELVVGVVSGLIAILGGKSSKTAAHGEAEKQSSLMSKVLSIGISLAAAVFGAFIVMFLSLLTNLILAGVLGRNPNNPRDVILNSPMNVLLIAGIAIAVIGWLLGRFINTNRFSLHYYWRNRMMRAYLGVSRDEYEREKTRNKFTDFDLDDNVQMYDLKQKPPAGAQKPLHVVNVALNLAGGEKLEWQDRKAESFSISPLHSGSYWLGYRDSEHYGGKKGISLATSVAISGAAASPNMGYMMTSPVVRFIMTLFNVRLGFWLGNPGVAGSGSWTTLGKPTFNRDSPTQSVRPIFAEALGKTNDKSPYVYLSDGGHFDNFGLYEMILRRSRFIIVSDASTDADYCYESLAYAIRQVRVDFGVPIEFRGKLRLGKDLEEANKYCAIADIRYSCVDKQADPALDGVLIYIKPSLDGSEPADVLNFHESDDAFPQDTIADQWFGEAQFESYRMLGSHMIEKLCSSVVTDETLPPFRKFEEQAKLHLG